MYQGRAFALFFLGTDGSPISSERNIMKFRMQRVLPAALWLLKGAALASVVFVANPIYQF